MLGGTRPPQARTVLLPRPAVLELQHAQRPAHRRPQRRLPVPDVLLVLHGAPRPAAPRRRELPLRKARGRGVEEKDEGQVVGSAYYWWCLFFCQGAKRSDEACAVGAKTRSKRRAGARQSEPAAGKSSRRTSERKVNGVAAAQLQFWWFRMYCEGRKRSHATPQLHFVWREMLWTPRAQGAFR